METGKSLQKGKMAVRRHRRVHTKLKESEIQKGREVSSKVGFQEAEREMYNCRDKFSTGIWSAEFTSLKLLKFNSAFEVQHRGLTNWFPFNRNGSRFLLQIQSQPEPQRFIEIQKIHTFMHIPARSLAD